MQKPNVEYVKCLFWLFFIRSRTTRLVAHSENFGKLRGKSHRRSIDVSGRFLFEMCAFGVWKYWISIAGSNWIMQGLTAVFSVIEFFIYYERMKLFVYNYLKDIVSQILILSRNLSSDVNDEKHALVFHFRALYNPIIYVRICLSNK